MPTPTTPTTTYKVDGASLRAARKGAGLEIKELAEKVGVDRSYISCIETGRRPNVSPSVFARIVAALGAERESLLGTDEPDQVAS